MDAVRKFFEPSDMTEGEPWKKIFQFCIPLLIGNIAQQLYSTFDSIVVGKHISDDALAAVGVATPLYSMLLVLFAGISTGATILISQYFGAKNKTDLSYAIGNCISLTGIVSVVLTIVTSSFVIPVLRALDTPADILPLASEYLTIICYGIIGPAYFNIISGILRGLGDSSSSVIYIIIACAVNIILDYVVVLFLKMGVAGVAIVTVLSQILSVVLCFIKLSKETVSFELRKEYLIPRKKYVVDIIRLGVPTGVANALTNVANILVQTLINSFGGSVITACTAVSRVNMIAMMPNITFGNTMTAYTGQNVGARKWERIEKGARQGIIIALVVAASMSAVTVIFGRSILGMFTDTPEVIELAYRMCLYMVPGYLSIAVCQSRIGILNGAGRTDITMYISIFTAIALHMPLSYLIRNITITPDKPLGMQECMWVALSISYVVGAILFNGTYVTGMWKKKLDMSKKEKL